MLPKHKSIAWKYLKINEIFQLLYGVTEVSSMVQKVIKYRVIFRIYGRYMLGLFCSLFELFNAICASWCQFTCHLYTTTSFRSEVVSTVVHCVCCHTQTQCTRRNRVDRQTSSRIPPPGVGQITKAVDTPKLNDQINKKPHILYIISTYNFQYIDIFIAISHAKIPTLVLSRRKWLLKILT